MIRRRKNNIGVFAIIITIIGISFIVLRTCNLYYLGKQEEKRLERFFSVSNESNLTNNVDQINSFVSQEEYIAVLEIPKIQLKRGLYSIQSDKNDVDKNLQVLSLSIFPIEQKSNVLIAGHSGYGRTAIFNYLPELKLKDDIILYFNKIQYRYQVVDKYRIEKTGTMLLKNYHDKHLITLITCIVNSNQQLVIVGNLVEKRQI